MIDEDFAKTIEKTLDKDLKLPLNGGPTRPSKITLAVELDQVIEGLHSRIKNLETIKAAVELLKATL